MMHISIIIPIIPDEDPEYVYRTVEGIERTIGLPLSEYTITFVGRPPSGLYSKSSEQKWNVIPSRDMVGIKRNIGAKYAMQQFNPDVLVFLDAHMNFFDNESKNWGAIIHKFLISRSDAVVGPAISIYNNPQHRGFGAIAKVAEDAINMEISWAWVGNAVSSDPFEVPGLCGCMMAMTPSTFNDSIIGFMPYFRIEDIEISMRLWLLGKTIYSIPELTVGHRFAISSPPQTKEQLIEWGSGQILFAFLNLGEPAALRLYQKGIHASPNKAESFRLATTSYWRQVKKEILSKMVRTSEQYFRWFS